MNKKTLIATLSVIALVAMTASATAYLMEREETKPAAVKAATVQTAAPAVVAAQPVGCDDGNIVGKAIGGVGGGVLASNLGKGNGKTAATIGGTLGGAYIGGEVIPTRNVTCR